MKVLIARPDSNGDVLLAEPAIRAVAMKAHVDLLVSHQGHAAGELIPRVDRLLVHQLPWIDANPMPVTGHAFDLLISEIKDGRYDKAIIFTSFHQSALPLALAMRLAGVPWIAARSEDYPGSLLDLRYTADEDVHEVQRSLGLAQACGFAPPTDERIRIKYLPAIYQPERPYVVIHPGGSASSRRWEPNRWRELVYLLTPTFDVVVTGDEHERDLAEFVAGDAGTSYGGKTTLPELASLIAGARLLLSGNTSSVHLASAVGTRVLLLFSPVVPLMRWSPWKVPYLALGNQQAPCAGSRMRECAIPGHPCLNTVSAEEVFESALYLMGES